MSTETPCMFCASGAALEGDALSVWAQCSRCLARGPAVLRIRPDAEAQAWAAWGAGRKFGKVAVAAVPGGMPAFTCSAAERLRLIAENMYEGAYGPVDGMLLLTRAGAQLMIVPHNLSAGDIDVVLTSARETTRARSAALPKRTN